MSTWRAIITLLMVVIVTVTIGHGKYFVQILNEFRDNFIFPRAPNSPSSLQLEIIDNELIL